jgi:predicted dehydrogenase
MPDFVLPAPRTPPPLDAPTLRWGILGPGKIASVFVDSLKKFTRQTIKAVASRSLDRARSFVQRLGDCDALGSYEQLVHHPAVDIVYVSTPHSSHYEHVMLSLKAGKHVLVEKPFAVNAAQANEMVRAAKERNLFLMEAMWPRFLPAFDTLRQILDEGIIGDITSVVSDLGEYFRPDPTHRLYAPELGGGALLDLGVYLVSLSSLFIGTPNRISATAQFTATGVDAQVSIILQNGSGDQSTLFTSLNARTPTGAFITGTNGTLHMDSPFYVPGKITINSLDRSRKATREFETRSPAEGLCYEGAEAARRIAEGSRESPFLTLQESAAIMETLDAIREAIVGDAPSF